MQKRLLLFLFIYLFQFSFSFFNPSDSVLIKDISQSTSDLSFGNKLYEEMKLDDIVNSTAFKQAIYGYTHINAENKDILTLIDFSKPSTEERLYVLDIKHRKLLYSSVVSHGKNSGEIYATHFSNEEGSNKSSLGFFKTESTYQGKNGYSLVLDGLEEGINDKAKERAIVMHGADYSTPSLWASSSRLGRSLGCPAIPRDLCRPIIDTIKGGSLLYIYANDETYLEQSRIISSSSMAT